MATTERDSGTPRDEGDPDELEPEDEQEPYDGGFARLELPGTEPSE